MRLAIAGGGTGGHLFPGLALAEELMARGADNSVLFLGARGGMEEKIVPQHGYRLELLPSLKGGLLSLDAPRKAWRLCRGYLQARKLLLDSGTQAVIGLGGYASALPVLAAWGVQIPVLTLEQNAVPGRVTRLCACLADAVGVQFQEAARRLRAPDRVELIGNPLRRRLAQAAAEGAKRNLEARPAPEEPHLLVLGGSQGAHFLNELIVQAWPKLKKAVPNLRVTLISGRLEAQRASDAFATAGIRGQAIPFTERMEEHYAQADVVLARAGATSLAEVSAFALPSILVPYPFATDDHQSVNARVYAAAGAAWVLPQATLTHDRLAQRVADTVLQPERRRRMAAAAHYLAKPRAAADAIDRAQTLAGVRVAAVPATQPVPAV